MNVTAMSSVYNAMRTVEGDLATCTIGWRRVAG